MLEKIYLANPSGFCAGVKYAISFLENVYEVSESQVYVRKGIVHNERVVNDFKDKGIVFVDELDAVPDESTVVFSAHGVSPDVVEHAKNKKMKIADATCPLVSKVHKKARQLSETHELIYLGHRGHDETVGIMGETRMHLVECIEDVKLLVSCIDSNKRLTYLMQTTLSIFDSQKIVDKISEIFPWVEHPTKDDICYATTQRQQAVLEMMDQVDSMLVIGSSNSSNTIRLLEMAQLSKPISFRVNSVDEISKDDISDNNIKILGITAGASSPQIVIQEILRKLEYFFPEVEILPFPGSSEDTMNFKVPNNLFK